MGEIELVIKLPEDKYNDIVEMYDIFPADWKELGLAYIKNGIKLPKGHGRLIDADELKQNDEIALWLSRDAVRTGKMLKTLSRLFIKKIDDAPTIIEANKSESEVQE